MLLTTALLAVASPAGAPLLGDEGRVELQYKAYRDFRLELPAERFDKLSGELPGGYGVTLDGTKLVIDADGDGTPERAVEGKEDDFGVRHAVVTCRRGEGSPTTFRLRDEGDGWQFAASGAMTGKIGDTSISIVDQNNDGRYDGIGVDAMIVGSGKRAQLLSKVANVAGELVSIAVEADGSALSYAAYDGPVGTVDFKSELETDAKLLSAVIVSSDGQLSFDLAKAPAGLRVPAGDYRIHSGKLGLGQATVQVLPGKSAKLDVADGGSVTLDWGGPTRAEFGYERRGTQLAFSPEEVWYYGNAGEEYAAWTPRGKSPEFTVKERKLGTELTKAIFPGSC